MTKVTILGQKEPKKELKRIEFVRLIDNDISLSRACGLPSDWENIILIEKGYTNEGLDLMYAFDELNDGILYLGHFNDGVI